MERIRLLTEVKVKAATERCDALLASIEKLQNKVIPSPATRAVIEAISTGVVTLKTRLKELTNDQELQYLNDAEIELKVHKNTQHLPYFHVILGLVGPSDVLSIPPELAAPLRRQMKSLFGNKVETIITSAADLNYTITEISSALRALLEQLNANPPDVFPDRIFVVSIPVVEYDNALLHCILAHEMGHPLLEASSIMEHALAKAQIDQAKLQEMIDTITDRAGRVGGKQSQVTIEDVLLKAEIVKAVTEAIPNWVTEVSADLFGVLLFGPAYFLFISRLHFYYSIQRPQAILHRDCG